jgi:hypothetical protein
MLEDVRKRIRQGFYVDQLKLPQETPQKTAEEVRALIEEQMRLMGPVLGRQHFELLRPLVTRLFAIMDRRKMFPPMPAAVQGKKFIARYSSLLARAQRMQEMQNIQRAIVTLQPIAQMRPDIMDNVNLDKLTKEVLTGYGVPERLMPTDQELRKTRQAQAQAAQDAKAKADQTHQSEVAKNTAPMIQQMGNAVQGQQPGGQ